MKILTLERYYSPFGVWGKLYGLESWLFTMEREWENNQPYISCIPEGLYMCKRHNSPAHGETFILLNTEPRTHILFHVGNKPKDFKGCIGVGFKAAIVENEPFIVDSRNAFKYFMNELNGLDHFGLVITSFTAYASDT